MSDERARSGRVGKQAKTPAVVNTVVTLVLLLALTSLVLHAAQSPPPAVAEFAPQVQQHINSEFHLPCSLGVATNKLVAKIANNIGKDSAPLKEIAHTEVSFRNPVLVGLAVCSHQADASDTVIFSDVSVDTQAAPAARAQ